MISLQSVTFDDECDPFSWVRITDTEIGSNMDAGRPEFARFCRAVKAGHFDDFLDGLAACADTSSWSAEAESFWESEYNVPLPPILVAVPNTCRSSAGDVDV